jgi:hypothetical protein
VSIAKGSIGPPFGVRIRTGNLDQASICPFALREISVLSELALGHLRYLLTDVPPQSNSPPDTVLGKDIAGHWQVRSAASSRQQRRGPREAFAYKGQQQTSLTAPQSKLEYCYASRRNHLLITESVKKL